MLGQGLPLRHTESLQKQVSYPNRLLWFCNERDGRAGLHDVAFVGRVEGVPEERRLLVFIQHQVSPASV